jgi:hypothetical protein
MPLAELLLEACTNHKATDQLGTTILKLAGFVIPPSHIQPDQQWKNCSKSDISTAKTIINQMPALNQPYTNSTQFN